jgi:hypothetical protein
VLEGCFNDQRRRITPGHLQEPVWRGLFLISHAGWTF